MYGCLRQVSVVSARDIGRRSGPSVPGVSHDGLQNSMYVIFPADEVVSLTYGRVIIPRTSKSRTPSTPLERESFDSCNPTVRINNPYEIESNSFSGSEHNSYLYNGDSPSTSLSDPGRFKLNTNSALQREKSTNRSFFKREFSLSVKRERSPAALHPSTLGPDPRLQITNLQHTPSGDNCFVLKVCFTNMM